MTPEGKVKAKINKMLKEFGGQIWKDMPVPGGFGKSGLDYHLCVNGFFVAIEAKAPGKEPTLRQQVTINAMRYAKARVYIVDGDEAVNLVRRCLNDLCYMRVL